MSTNNISSYPYAPNQQPGFPAVINNYFTTPPPSFAPPQASESLKSTSPVETPEQKPVTAAEVISSESKESKIDTPTAPPRGSRVNLSYVFQPSDEFWKRVPIDVDKWTTEHVMLWLAEVFGDGAEK
jgi:hypothetical protein